LNVAELPLTNLCFRLRTAIDNYNEETKQVAVEIPGVKDQNPQKWQSPEWTKQLTPIEFKKMAKVYRLVQKYSFIGFAGTFVLFSLIYWIWLIVCSKYLEWNSEVVAVVE
jgi:hypothetical protein